MTTRLRKPLDKKSPTKKIAPQKMPPKNSGGPKTRGVGPATSRTKKFKPTGYEGIDA